MSSDADDEDDTEDRKRDRTRRRSRREIDRAIDDLDPRADPDRLESWRRFIGLDPDPSDPYHRRWIQAGADEPLTDAEARRAVEQAATACDRERAAAQDTDTEADR